MRVLLVDDHRLVRQVMARLLQAEADIEVIGEAENGADAVALARQLAPEIVLINVRLPIMTGVEATHAILADVPGACVVGMTLVDNPAEAEMITAAGARACISKSGSVEDLLRILRDVHSQQLNDRSTGASRRMTNSH